MELTFEIIQAIANVFVIVGVIVALKQLILSRKIAEADLERRKKEATMSFTYEILSKLDELNPIFKKYKVLSYDMYNNDKDLRDSITQYLKLLERVCVGINTQIYDINIFQRICGYRVWKRWCCLKPLIYEIRNKRSFNRYYIEYEIVANKLEQFYGTDIPSNGDIENKI